MLDEVLTAADEGCRLDDDVELEEVDCEGEVLGEAVLDVEVEVLALEVGVEDDDVPGIV